MKKFTLPVVLVIIFAVLLVVAAPILASNASAAGLTGSQLLDQDPSLLSKLPPGTFPYFYIEAIKVDESITIKGYNFPADDSFNVLMGNYGTLGVGGTKVATQDTGTGGSFTATYLIPANQKGKNQIAVRLESPTSGYFAYNWFYNTPATSVPEVSTPSAVPTAVTTPIPVTPAPSPTPAKTPVPAAPAKTYPYFFIDAVVKNDSVTIKAYNFPANDTFNVTFGLMGTQGVKGTAAGTQTTGAGGSFTATYKIPAGLYNKAQIAIRLESPTSGYYAYNWFYNNPSASAAVPVPDPKPAAIAQDDPTKPPIFFIKAVVRNNTVTIDASNFPHDDTFTVTMGVFGAMGLGTVVGTQDSGTGKFTATYTIPAGLANASQISIRLQSAATGFFSYNWFYNNTTP